MQQVVTRIEAWHVDEVRMYLTRAFVGSRIEDYPKGGDVAHLFVISEPGAINQCRARHHLLVTGAFFARHTDRAALRQGLRTADVTKHLERVGERTVELH